MAKPLSNLNKTTFLNNYNIVEISNDINVIMKCLETFNPNKQVVAFGIKKQPKVTLEDIMSEIKDIKNEVNNHKVTLEDIMSEIINIKRDVKKIKSRLDEHDRLFKQHG